MSRLLLRLFLFIMLHNFKSGLKIVLGIKSPAKAIQEEKNLEAAIRWDNNLLDKDKVPNLTWDNTNQSPRERYARYITLKEFNRIGELLITFKAIQFPRIIES
jgi:hypothetical protein